jgi:hypothetical protein
MSKTSFEISRIVNRQPYRRKAQRGLKYGELGSQRMSKIEPNDFLMIMTRSASLSDVDVSSKMCHGLQRKGCKRQDTDFHLLIFCTVCTSFPMTTADFFSLQLTSILEYLLELDDFHLCGFSRLCPFIS